MVNSDVWGLTSFFNPASYRSRLSNYRIFRRHLEIPLATAELSFGSSFELSDADADILLQVERGDVLWQKERLLNLLLEVLPVSCRYVVWLDCDIVFADRGWWSHAKRALELHTLIQPFQYAARLPAMADPTRPGLGELPASPTATSSGPTHDGFVGTLGLAWAARLALLKECGLYDACIAGGGDQALAAAAYGRFELATQPMRMNARQSAHYHEWARKFHSKVRGDVTCASGTVLHLWHGRTSDRRYIDRHRDFARYDFDPWTDIEINSDGCWAWSSNKFELHEHLKSYFSHRSEDGT